MPRETIASLIFAGGSLAIGAICGVSLHTLFRHGMTMLFPLGLIAFVRWNDIYYYHTTKELEAGRNVPTPAIMVRIAGWVILAALVATFHFLGVPHDGPRYWE